MNKLLTLKTAIIGCFIAVPILSSIISTFHIVDMFFLGNPIWMSVVLAITIEIGSVASFLTLSILSKLNKFIVWTVFIILFSMQIIGNIYFSYDWITHKIVQDPNWIKNFKEMIEFFSFNISDINAKMILALFIGVPIPLVSVFLLKSLSDYIGTDMGAEIKGEITNIQEVIIGPPGPSGPQGITGLNGTQGPQGSVGVEGFQGSSGNDGTDGPQGIIGQLGPQGPLGLKGYQGPQGMIEYVQDKELSVKELEDTIDKIIKDSVNTIPDIEEPKETKIARERYLGLRSDTAKTHQNSEEPKKK